MIELAKWFGAGLAVIGIVLAGLGGMLPVSGTVMFGLGGLFLLGGLALWEWHLGREHAQRAATVRRRVLSHPPAER